MRLVLLILLFPLHLMAATYYVRTDGNNGNSGTVDSAGGAWRNVWYAAASVSAGDTVNVGSGTFYEFVTNTVSGTIASPITFQGAASFASIIDPSTQYSNNWTDGSSEIASCYKHASMPAIYELYISGRRVGNVWTTNDLDFGMDGVYSGDPYSTGAEFLGRGSSQTVTLQIAGYPVIQFWHGIEALWGEIGRVFG